MSENDKNELDEIADKIIKNEWISGTIVALIGIICGFMIGGLGGVIIFGILGFGAGLSPGGELLRYIIALPFTLLSSLIKHREDVVACFLAFAFLFGIIVLSSLLWNVGK